MKNLRHAVSTIRSSPQRRELFDKCCAKYGLGRKQLVIDVETRWNSTLAMFKRLLELKKAFVSAVNQIKSLKALNITSESEIWGKIEDLIELLAPFEEATKMLSQGHSPTISDTAMIYHYIFNKLEVYIDGTDSKLKSTRSKTANSTCESWLRDEATAGWTKLRKYYSSSEELVYVVGTGMPSVFGSLSFTLQYPLLFMYSCFKIV